MALADCAENPEGVMALTLEEIALVERLRFEQRRCGACGYVVIDPTSGRCPRCNEHLPNHSLSCRDCFHRMICPGVPREKVPVEETVFLP